MKSIKIGDVVGRKSYKKDIIFRVKNIINTEKESIAILTGVTKRVEADSNLDDLELIEKDRVRKEMEEIDSKIQTRVSEAKIANVDENYIIGILTQSRKSQEKLITGKILHLDGDKKYSERSYRYYRRLGLNAIVKNIPEYKQPKEVYSLLQMYKPDILVITGHDRNDKKRNRL